MKRKPLFNIAGIVAIAALIPTWVWAQGPSRPDQYGYGPHMMGWGGGWYGMILGPLFMVLIFAAVIAFVVFLVRGIGGPGQGSQPAPPAIRERTALDILKERFARGEIDKDEFEERRRVLGE